MRLFIAYDFDDISSDKFISLQKRFLSKLDLIRLTKKETFHLTVKFIGDFENTKMIIDKLKDNDFIKNSKNLLLNSNLITAFPNIFNSRVIVCKFNRNETLYSLFKQVENNLSDIGIKKDERDFTPHITLARTIKPIKFNEIYLKESNLFENEFKITNLILYNSTLTKKGPIYDPIYVF